MQIVFLVSGWLVLLVGVYFCMTRRSAHELEQASLLPFADDPEVARSMSKATGKVCDRVVMIPTQAAADLAASQYIDA